MKKTIIIFFTFIAFLYNAQIRKSNLLIMIDEKPCLIVNNLQLESQTMKSINANYVVGTIDISENDYTRLLTDQSMSFNLNFESILANHSLSSKYEVTIPKIYLNQKYIIINIFNMNIKNYRKKYSELIKNNKEYYVVIETPNSMKFD
ncbi:hypothetical protein [Chryseobacterium sp. JUb7]|uniref:hypothetical protein n=1 Tax=Chryseobacterium sp. JUb7 TaxID=2940599 RepID=UPI00216769AE|nr:hypothetical protein [Chryseobacterium sp. JUb7]MCS3530754.1 hypothetical protein [Chryseobacterium sp. JUb7]